MRIESGPTGERKVRTLLMLLMVGVFAVWFAYDGWIGWPGENMKEHLDQLPPEIRKDAKLIISEEVVAGKIETVRDILKEFDIAKQRKALTEKLGAAPIETPARWFFFGPAHRIEIGVENGRLQKAVDRDSARSSFSILLQKILAVALGICTFYLIWFVMRVRKTRAVLDDAGLSYNSIGPIPWEDMQSLDISRFAPKGQVDLVYSEHGAQRRLRLDEYHIAAFDDIIDALCAKKGFENPLPVKEEAQADSSTTTSA